MVADWRRAERMWRSHLKVVVAGGMDLAVPIKWVTPRSKPQPHISGQWPHGWSTGGGMVLLTVALFDPPHSVDLSKLAAMITFRA